MTPTERALLSERLRAAVEAYPPFAPAAQFVEYEAERGVLTVVGLDIADPQELTVEVDYDWPRWRRDLGTISVWERAETYRRTTITFGSERQRAALLPANPMTDWTFQPGSEAERNALPEYAPSDLHVSGRSPWGGLPIEFTAGTDPIGQGPPDRYEIVTLARFKCKAPKIRLRERRPGTVPAVLVPEYPTEQERK